MKQQEYLELISRFEASSLTCLEIEEENFKIRMEWRAAGSAPDGAVSASVPAAVPQDMDSSQSAVPAGDPAGSLSSAAAETAENLIHVKAPLVGVFYAAPSPDSEPFVKAGDRVEQGQTLCLIEAMKMMNELKAPASGIVRSVRGIDGQLAEYGQILFEVAAC